MTFTVGLVFLPVAITTLSCDGIDQSQINSIVIRVHYFRILKIEDHTFGPEEGWGAEGGWHGTRMS